MRRNWFTRPWGLIVAVLAMSAIGCDAEQPTESRSLARRVSSGSSPAPASAPVAALADNSLSMPTEAAPQANEPSAAAGRKIIYNAHVDLVTDDLGSLEKKLGQLIATAKAYIADSDRTGSAGASLRGTWKVRVPVDSYDPFVKGVVGLGELVSVRADSQDVSEEFFDLDARQAAKKVEEARLLKHLSDSTGKLDEILAVERELSRVRTEIERMQGRLRALANLTSLATVTIIASEIKGYVPPQAPTLGTKVARSFGGSLDALRQFGEGLLIAFVALVPWLPLIAVLIGLGYWIVRRWLTRFARVSLIDVTPPSRARS